MRGIREREESRMAARILGLTTEREGLSFMDMGKTIDIEASAEKIQMPVGSLRRGVRQLDA